MLGVSANKAIEKVILWAVDWLTCCKLWPDVASYRESFRKESATFEDQFVKKLEDLGWKPVSKHLDMGVPNKSTQVSCYIVSADRSSSEFIPCG